MLAERIEAGDFPSAVYVVAERGRVRFADALGDAVREPEVRAATLGTVFDLASLTKPLVTGMLLARLVERGAVGLDEPVAEYLKAFAVADKRTVTVRHLLTHTSGLPAWQPLYLLTGGDRDRVLDVIVGQPLEQAPGSRVVYSDLGFITLGLLAQRVTGTRLADLARREIFDPLKLSRTFFNPERSLQTEVAACESGGNSYERGMCEAEVTRKNSSAPRRARTTSACVSVSGETGSRSSVAGSTPSSTASARIVSESGSEPKTLPPESSRRLPGNCRWRRTPSTSRARLPSDKRMTAGKSGSEELPPPSTTTQRTRPAAADASATGAYRRSSDDSSRPDTNP